MKISQLRQIIKEEIENILREINVNPDSPEVAQFLDKVRSENPDKLAKFRSLVYNKGLETALDSYQEFDPAVIQQNKMLAAKEKTRQNKRAWYDKNKDRINREKKAKEENAIKYAIEDFVSFLPDNFPEQWQKLNNSERFGDQPIDANYYMLLGAYIGKYDTIVAPGEYGDPNKFISAGDFIEKYINEEPYDEYFYRLMYGKYGDEIEF